MTDASAPATNLEDGTHSVLPMPATKRISRVSAFATLFILTLRQHLHGRRWMVLLLLFFLPPGMALLIRAAPAPVPSVFLEFLLSWMLIPQALLPLIALLYASGIVQDEQEEQTITYLLVRPIPKWMLYILKMLAAWATTVVLVTVLTVLTYVAVYANSGISLTDVLNRCFRGIEIHSLAVMAYCSLFGLISLLTKRSLVVGVLYIAVIEGLLANLPLSLRMGTVIYYSRLIAYRTLDFMVVWPRGREDDVAAAAWSLDTKADPKLLEHPQLTTCVLVLVMTSLVCTLLGAVLCAQREFHVKTPEKD
jgi:ABC-2 type transport system permease protein